MKTKTQFDAATSIPLRRVLEILDEIFPHQPTPFADQGGCAPLCKRCKLDRKLFKLL
jgi:hypothetical protein